MATVNAAARTRKWAPAGRVLLVEDDPMLADMYALALEVRGIIVDRARTAAEGLRLGRHSSADVILLDIGLPDGSGLDLLKDLRADPNSARSRVMMFSNSREPAMISRALELGARGYLVKAECTPARLAQKVTQLFRDHPRMTA